MATRTVKTEITYNPSTGNYDAVDHMYDTETGVTTQTSRSATSAEAEYYLKASPQSTEQPKTYIDYFSERMEQSLSNYDDDGNPV